MIANAEIEIGKCVEGRTSFGEALVELGRDNPDVIVLDADLGGATKTSLFLDAFPDRFYQVGIAEQNMVGIAAGLATMGFIPFVSSFASFMTRRVADQIAISVAYPKLSVMFNGSYSGLATNKTGATHQALEDMAIMRAIPNMKVFVPADAVETRLVVNAAAQNEGPVYIRTSRCAVPVIFGKDHKFEPGKAVMLEDGSDITIVSTGIMTMRALDAVQELKRSGISAGLLHVPSIKPFDEEAIAAAAKDTGNILTVENHSIIGGLGSAVAEVMAEHGCGKLKRMGVLDIFGESGADEALFRKYGLTSEHIIETAKQMLSARG
ncbi:MAG: transketolase family protein [Armatimonadota bacterium]